MGARFLCYGFVLWFLRVLCWWFVLAVCVSGFIRVFVVKMVFAIKSGDFLQK